MTDRIVLIQASHAEKLPEVIRPHALPEGWPIPISAESAEIVMPVFRFMREKHKLRRLSSMNTVRAYSEDMKDWWDYLAHFQVHWTAASIEHLARYRDAMIGTVSPETGKPYGDSTVVRRCGTVRRFYSWARDVGLYSGMVDWAEPRLSRRVDADPLAHLRTSFARPTTGVVPKLKGGEDQHVRVIPFKELELIRERIGPDPETQSDGASYRDRLYMEVMLDSGARISEVEAIWSSDIEALDIEGREDWHRVSLRLKRNTKGGKERSVPLFVRTMKALLRYIRGERHIVVSFAKNRAKSSGETYTEPNELFLNGVTSKALAGQPLRSHRFWEIFHAAVGAAGIHAPCLTVDPDTGKQTIRMVAKYHPHDLRHTFAVNEYHSRKAAGETEPWKAIQEILGHANLSTTLKIYLRVCQETEKVVSDASYLLFRAMIRRQDG